MIAIGTLDSGAQKPVFSSPTNKLDMISAYETAFALSGATHGACVSLTATQQIQILNGTDLFTSQDSSGCAFTTPFVADILRRAEPVFASNARELATGAPVLAHAEGMQIALLSLASPDIQEKVIWILLYDTRPSGLSWARREALTRFAEFARVALAR